jgi:hypothetical protein
VRLVAAALCGFLPVTALVALYVGSGLRDRLDSLNLEISRLRDASGSTSRTMSLLGRSVADLTEESRRVARACLSNPTGPVGDEGERAIVEERSKEPSAEPETRPLPAEERASVLESAFLEQRPNSSWSLEGHDAVKATLVGLESSSLSITIECRETLCRVESTHASMDQYHEFGRSAFKVGGYPWRGSRKTILPLDAVEGSPVTVVTFLGKPRTPGPTHPMAAVP